MKRVLSFLLLIPLTFTGCAVPAPEHIPVETENMGGVSEVPAQIEIPALHEVPIYIGKRDRPSSFDLQYTWSAAGLSINRDGHLRGKLNLSLGIPPQASLYKDMLFIQLVATYIWPGYGDLSHHPMGDYIPVHPIYSSDKTIQFILDHTLPVPPVKIDTDGGMPLEYIEIELTFVRGAYQNQDQGSFGKVYWIISVSAQDPDGLARAVSFDQHPQDMEGWLDSYNHHTSYLNWFDKNVTLPVPPTPEREPYPGQENDIPTGPDRTPYPDP